ncbi:hypothetical protein [Gilvimarinus polysaccharolyticus]|uniref:hypothetical protein n=1 Tax=Gilvimarinus polysaccharolyticus TaxID=863921 RepID=UPI0012F886C7|nr:hypothetical protein [Gilvimarinus polysaccharolyticus]
MKRTLVIILTVLLASCGDDAIVHRSGESTTTKVVALTSENEIFVQGVENPMSMAEFDRYLSKLISGNESFSFVIQSSLGADSEVTRGIVEFIQKHGVPKRHIAVAKPNA